MDINYESNKNKIYIFGALPVKVGRANKNQMA